MSSKSHEMDLCSGSLWKKIFVYSVPLMFTNILQVLFNMSDVAVVGKFAGAIALGAVGSTSILVTLFTGILLGLASGVNALTALHIGSKDDEGVKRTVHTAVIILMNTKDELIDGAVLYLRIYLLGMPALGLYNFGNAVLSAAGDTKRPLYYLAFAGVVNVILNLFFVIVCHLGVAGVALASMISQFISAFLILRALLTGKEKYCLRLSEIRFDKRKAVGILQIGIPSAFQYSLFAFANLFVQSSVNSFDHVLVEGNSAAANADPLVYDMMAAFYTACSSFIAQNFGARKKKRILQTYLICLFYSFITSLVLGVGIYLARYPFLYLFTSDKAVVEAGITRLSIMALSYSASAFMDASIAASRGLGKTAVPTFVVVMGSCVFRIIWIYTIFAYFHTIQSLYILYVFSWGITAIAENIYFFHVYRHTLTGKTESHL